jgi:pilus assembly protein CpaC
MRTIQTSARHAAVLAAACMLCLAVQPVRSASTGVVVSTPQAAREIVNPTVAQVQSAKPTLAAQALPPQLSSQPARIGPQMNLTVGKSTLLRLPEAIERMSVGNPAIADVTPISERELYLLGKDLGTTNLIIWSKNGQATVIDIHVGADSTLLEKELRTLLPTETDVRVLMTADSVVLQGTVADPVKSAQAEEIASAWIRRLTRGLVLPISAGGSGSGTSTTISVGQTSNAQNLAQVAAPRVINMLRVRAPMQVMLEVKVAEISKNLLDKLGITARATGSHNNTTFGVLSQSSFFNQLLGSAVVGSPRNFVQLDAQAAQGIIKLLAEPNIMAISGQQASFRAGGKIFIPVSRRNDTTGGSTVTLEEKEFGVGLQFRPTVLEGNRINLHVIPEVSELQQSGSPFTTVDGATSVLPSFTLRRAETTVQLHDGQSFMIAGMIQNSSSTTINRFPGLGDIPILGALFRSTDFQQDKTELMFVITPRLVKPLPPNYALPTDFHADPNASELFLNGRLEGSTSATPAPVSERAPSGTSGFEMK